MRLRFLINNWGQTSALKVAYIFNVFGVQSCLMLLSSLTKQHMSVRNTIITGIQDRFI